MLSGMNEPNAPDTVPVDTPDTPAALAPVYPIEIPVGSSGLYLLIQDRMDRLGLGDVIGYIRQRRELDPPMTYNKIALELSNLCDKDVTNETARRWDLGLSKARRAQAAGVAAAALLGAASHTA